MRVGTAGARVAARERPGPLTPAEKAVYSFVTTIARGYLGQPVWNPDPVPSR